MIRNSRTHNGWRLPTETSLLDSASPLASIEESSISNISFSFENPLKTRLGDSFFQKIPKDPGVYTFIDAKGRPLYIGKANNLKQRLMSYQAAKPGQTPDHILEMIEHAHDLKFELRTDGDDALRREEELIRSVRPPYNVALNYDVSYLYIALKADAKTNQVEFRLSHMEVKEGFKTYGCFRHRGKAKAAYSALMRLLYAAFCERERFQLPSKICRSSPAYRFTVGVDPEALKHVESYLAGRTNDLLRFLVDALLAKENLPKPLYLPMQRDLEILKEFYRYGPQDTARLAKRLRLKSGLVPQQRIDAVVSREYLATLEPVLTRSRG
jgi:hypothetical protein